MEALANLGFRTMTFAELPAYLAGDMPGNRVILTIDDIGNTDGTDLLKFNHTDFWENMYPTLHRLNFTAVLGVVTQKVSENEGNGWSWPELLRLQEEGYELASHSATHDVRMNHGLLTEAQFRQELCSSRDEIARRAGIYPNAYIWPFGAVLDSSTAGYNYLDIARECGYSVLVTVWESGAVVTLDQLERVPRYHPDLHVQDFEAVMEQYSCMGGPRD